MRILIAEDDFTSRAILSAVLKRNDHEVIEVINGLEALVELQKNNAPKLVILDWIMPEMDGLEVVTRVRSLENMQPPYIIMLTSKSESTNVISALDAGANDYLSKPFGGWQLFVL